MGSGPRARGGRCHQLQDHSNWGEVVFEGFGGFHRVVNAAGGAELDQAISALAPGAQVALMGLYSQAAAPPNLIALMIKNGSIRGTSVGSAAVHGDMVNFVDKHRINPPIAEVFTNLASQGSLRVSGVRSRLRKGRH
ncbi:hypothetical protein CFBP5473_24540 (plasmid) [Agrobacterium larrymoorei]|uniref:Alcohol dehydrogenase-like C-terminal domain-containing protein n=1 Tax=Agrobacterium larrymoorei TaxID=160699 RepID=A0A4D7E6V6_9HYPH|nr:hypothetical protein CFBP5473_24540 [Agrobacterium larrymoorei]